MKILVVNAGSSSLKYQLFDMDGEKVLAKGNCEKIGIQGSFIKYKANGIEKVFEGNLNDHTEALSKVFEILTNKEYGVISSFDDIDAVGHRVLHGGETFKESALVTPEVLSEIEKLIPLGPLHMPANIAGIRACQKIFGNKPQVAVFDTAFHANMPQEAFLLCVCLNLQKCSFQEKMLLQTSMVSKELSPKRDRKLFSVHMVRAMTSIHSKAQLKLLLNAPE